MTKHSQTKTSRRTFLKAAALTGAGIFTAGQAFANSTVVSVPARPLRTLFGGRGGGMSITTSVFGETPSGRTVDIYTLDNGRGVSVEVLSLGGIIRKFNVPDRNGIPGNISAILETAADYEKYRTSRLY